MITLRPAAERGSTTTPWLDSRHTFSFGAYDDPRYRGFGPLVAINEDRVAPAGGFPRHGHRNMEILSLVVSGDLEHQDTLGHRRHTGPGDVQWMSAGTGIRHSEYNASDAAPLHFLQVWIEPEQDGLPPAYAERHFDRQALSAGWRLVAGPAGQGAVPVADGPLPLRQNAFVYRAWPEAGDRLVHAPADGRRVWVQVISGTMHLEGLVLTAGDGAAVTGTEQVMLDVVDGGDVVLFDLP